MIFFEHSTFDNNDVRYEHALSLLNRKAIGTKNICIYKDYGIYYLLVDDKKEEYTDFRSLAGNAIYALADGNIDLFKILYEKFSEYYDASFTSYEANEYLEFNETKTRKRIRHE